MRLFKLSTRNVGLDEGSAPSAASTAVGHASLQVPPVGVAQTMVHGCILAERDSFPPPI